MIRKVKARSKTRFRVRYREPGNRNVKSKTFDTEDEAKVFEGDLARAKSGVVEFPKAKFSYVTLEQFGLEYFTKYVKVELAGMTQELYRSVWNNHIQPRIGAVPLSVLSASSEGVQEFKASLIADGVGNATVAKALSILSGMLNKAVEWGRISNNPVRAVKKPSGKRKKKIKPMPPAMILALIDVLPTMRDKRLVALMGFAGLRPGEALALLDTDICQDTISVDKAIALGDEKDTKTGKDRIVPILEELRPFLVEIEPGLLFSRADGQPWHDHDYRNWRKRVFKSAVRVFGVPEAKIKAARATAKLAGEKAVLPVGEWSKFRPYDLRHSFASRLLMDGRTPLEVAEVMGHSVETLLSTYAHVIAEMRWSRKAA